MRERGRPKKPKKILRDILPYQAHVIFDNLKNIYNIIQEMENNLHYFPKGDKEKEIKYYKVLKEQCCDLIQGELFEIINYCETEIENRKEAMKIIKRAYSGGIVNE